MTVLSCNIAGTLWDPCDKAVGASSLVPINDPMPLMGTLDALSGTKYLDADISSLSLQPVCKPEIKPPALIETYMSCGPAIMCVYSLGHHYFVQIFQIISHLNGLSHWLALFTV